MLGLAGQLQTMSTLFCFSSLVRILLGSSLDSTVSSSSILHDMLARLLLLLLLRRPGDAAHAVAAADAAAAANACAAVHAAAAAAHAAHDAHAAAAASKAMAAVTGSWQAWVRLRPKASGGTPGAHVGSFLQTRLSKGSRARCE